MSPPYTGLGATSTSLAVARRDYIATSQATGRHSRLLAVATDVERVLNRIGKRCFRNCYDTAMRKGQDFTIADLLRCDPALKLPGISERARIVRAANIRRLVREGLADEALSRCWGPRVPR